MHDAISNVGTANYCHSGISLQILLNVYNKYKINYSTDLGEDGEKQDSQCITGRNGNQCFCDFRTCFCDSQRVKELIYCLIQ